MTRVPVLPPESPRTRERESRILRSSLGIHHHQQQQQRRTPKANRSPTQQKPTLSLSPSQRKILFIPHHLLKNKNKKILFPLQLTPASAPRALSRKSISRVFFFFLILLRHIPPPRDRGNRRCLSAAAFTSTHPRISRIYTPFRRCDTANSKHPFLPDIYRDFINEYQSGRSDVIYSFTSNNNFCFFFLSYTKSKSRFFFFLRQRIMHIKVLHGFYYVEQEAALYEGGGLINARWYQLIISSTRGSRCCRAARGRTILWPLIAGSTRLQGSGGIIKRLLDERCVCVCLRREGRCNLSSYSVAGRPAADYRLHPFALLAGASAAVQQFLLVNSKVKIQLYWETTSYIEMKTIYFIFIFFLH